MKRRYTGAPKWVDYLAQFLFWLQWKCDRMVPNFSGMAGRLLNKYCNCELCQKRKKDTFFGPYHNVKTK